MDGQTKGVAPQQRHPPAAAASRVDEDQEELHQANEDFLARVERRLRECINDDLQQGSQHADIERETDSHTPEGVQTSAGAADSGLLAQRMSTGKALWLPQCRGVSAADASAALECLQVVRECVLQSTGGAAAPLSSVSRGSSSTIRPRVYLYTVLQCIRCEAEAAKAGSTGSPQESVVGARNAASRITGGMALLFMLLVQQLSPEGLHKNIHSDAKVLVLLLQAMDACSVRDERAEVSSGGVSHRPVLLLLAALQQCFSFQRQQPSGDSLGGAVTLNSRNSDSGSSATTITNTSNSSNRDANGDNYTVCSCFPARGVWLQLLKVLTEEARACVRHRARQTAQSLLHAAVAAAGTSATPASAEAEAATAARPVAPSTRAGGAAAAGNCRHQQHAAASLRACVSVLQEYISKVEHFPKSPLSSRHEEQALQRTRFVRVLPFLRRVLASLLQLPLSVFVSPGHRKSNGNRGNGKVGDRSGNDVEGRGSSSCGGGLESEQSTRQAAQAEEQHQGLLHAVQELCMRTAFLSNSGGGFTVEAALALRCLGDAATEALQQYLRQQPPQQQQQDAGYELQARSCREAAEGSGRFVAVVDILLLPVAGRLLSGLLQQQCGGSTYKSSHARRGSDAGEKEEGSSSKKSGGMWVAACAAAIAVDPPCNNREKVVSGSSVALSEATAQARGTGGTAGATQYAASWCDAVSAALDVLTQWTGLPVNGETVHQGDSRAGSSREKHTKSPFSVGQQQPSGNGRSDEGGRGESSGRGVVSVEDEATETALLLEQLQRLTLLPDEVQEVPRVEHPPKSHQEAAPADASTAAATDTGTGSRATRVAAGGGGEAAAADPARRHPYASRAEIFSRAWKRVMKCLCEGLAAVKDSTVAAAVAAAGKRLLEQATLLELPLLHLAVPYCLALLHYKQKQRWHEALQQTAQVFRSLEIVAYKQFSRGSPCFPRLQLLACSLLRLQLHQGHQQHHPQQLGQQVQPLEGNLIEYMEAYADLHRDAFAPLLERIVTMLALVETGALPENSTNSRSRNGSVHVSTVGSNSHTRSGSGTAEECGGLLASLQRRDLTVYRGDIRSCFAAALHAFSCRVLLSKSLLPLVFFMEVGDLSPADLVVFDERAAAAHAAESCRISGSGRSRTLEWCSNSWLLPLLPNCLKRDRLGLFAVYFFPLAQQLQQQARHALTAGKPLLARELCRLQQQVWGLLPGFCCQPLDLGNVLSSQQGGKLFDTMLQLLHEPVLRQDICASIVNLCAAVAVPPCAAAAAAAVATSSASTGSDASSIAAAQSNRRRAAALAAVLRAAVETGCSSQGGDEADEAVTALAAVAGSSCRDGRRLLQMRAAPLVGFLVVRFLQLHKLPTAGAAVGSVAAGGLGTTGTAASQQQRSFLAAVLLGETESLENLTESAKVKAAQHLLRAIKAYAPLCPKELLHANVRRFTSAFLNRARAAAAALGATAAASLGASMPSAAAGDCGGAAATAVLGATETAALVDITDALLPVLSDEFTVEMVGVMRDLLRVCVESLKKQPVSPFGLAASPTVGGGVTTANSAVDLLAHRQVLQVLLRRAYKTLKHVLERGLERLQRNSRQAEQHLQQLVQQEQHHPSRPPQQQPGHDVPQQPPARQGQQTSTALQEQSAVAGSCSLTGSGDLLPCGGEEKLLLSSHVLEELWTVLEPGRAVSWAASAEKARLGCLRVFVCYCLSAQARAEKLAGASSGGTSCGLLRVPALDTATAAGASRAAEWGALLEKTLPVLVPETLLCVKTPNRLVRETALDALSAIAETCEDDREKLSKLVLAVAAGLGGCFGGDPPLLKAAASLALSRLVFCFSEEMGEDLVIEVADVVLVMLEDDSTPAFLGALHFAKAPVFTWKCRTGFGVRQISVVYADAGSVQVLVHVLDPIQLEPFVPRILSLFESKAVTKARLKIRRLLEKLIKKLGDTAVEAAFPQEHLPLLRHLQRRMRKRQLRGLLCNAALQEGLSWEDLDFGNSNSNKKNETWQASEQPAKQLRRKHPKERFVASLEEDEEDEDDEGSDDEEEEPANVARSRKAPQQNGTKIKLSGKREVSRSGAATGDGAGDTAAAVTSKEPTSVYVQKLLDAAETTDVFRKPGGKKRTRCQAAATPVSLVDDSAGDTPVDLLSPAAAERVLLSRCMLKRRREGSLHVDGRASACEGAARHTDALAAKEEVYWNEEGRLVVLDDEEGHMKRTGKRLSSSAKAEPDTKERTPTRVCARDKSGEKANENTRRTLSCLAARRGAVKAARQQKRGGHFVQEGGKTFLSKKGKGDVMKNRKVEPYAYIRLNPAMIREKYRHKALKSLSTVFTKPIKGASISSASRGVQKTRQKRSRRSTKK